MKIEEYKSIYNALDSYEDIDALAAKGYDKELLFVIYTERHVREVKKNYYVIQRRRKHLLNKWKQGHSFSHLAQEACFSPVMLSHILMREMGMTKRQIRNAMRDYREVRDARISKELNEALAGDMVYSQAGAELQRKRGEEGEARIKDWLDRQGLTYQQEEDLKNHPSGKTVDFLLDKPIKVRFETHPEEERTVNWIESKGSFGDERKVRRDYVKQLDPYVNLWGPGMVVYWFGFLEGMEMWLEARDVKVVRQDFFE